MKTVLTGGILGTMCVTSWMLGAVIDNMVWRGKLEGLIRAIENDEDLEFTRARKYIERIFKM